MPIVNRCETNSLRGLPSIRVRPRSEAGPLSKLWSLMMQGSSFRAVALLGASLALLGGAATGSAAEFQVSTTPVVMDHVTIETSTPYQMVTSRLNGEVKRFDESYR